MQLFTSLTQAKPGCCVAKRKPSIPGISPSVPAISDDTKSNAPTEEGDSPNSVHEKDLDSARKQQEFAERAAISVQSGIRGQQSRKRMSVAAAEAAAKAEAAAAEAAAKAAKAAAAAAGAEKAKEAALQAKLDAEKKAAAEMAKAAALQAKLDAEKAKEAALQAKLDAEKKKTAADAQKAAAEAKVAEKKAAADAEKKAAEAKAAKKAKLAAQEAAARQAAKKAAAEKAALVGSQKASGPNFTLTEAEMAAQGVLRVRVISATGISYAGGLPDSSAKVFLSTQPEEVHETLVQNKTANPEWGEQFDFHGTLAEMANARLGVPAYLGVELNDGLGLASLPFGNEVIHGKAFEGQLNTQGTIKVFASFAPLKVLLSSVLYIKKTGLTNTRYTPTPIDNPNPNANPNPSPRPRPNPNPNPNPNQVHNIVTAEEAAHLVAIGTPRYARSSTARAGSDDYP